MPLPADLYTSIFHSLEDQIAIIDKEGCILDVNLAWRNFGAENDLPSGCGCTGHNYLDTLTGALAAGDSLAGEALRGISDVIAGRLAVFTLEYPCHSPNEKRWFTMRATALNRDPSQGLFVISHHNITKRKLVEERVQELAMQDPLTGLGNRRAFQFFLNKEMRNSSRSRTPIGLALFDVDYFKHYNDEFGHVAGDQCLTRIGKIIHAHARRPGDLAARIGGDEFALILGNTEPAIVREIAESVLKAVNELNLVIDESRQVTVSIGFLSVVPHAHHDEDFLFQEADKALYRAKSTGKNQVVHIHSDMPC